MIVSQPHPSAQVVLQPATVARQAPVTSRNIAAQLPDKEAAAAAIETFRKLGFETGPLVANSFSITAPVSLFEQVFAVKMLAAGNKLSAQWKDHAVRDHLPLAFLPPAVARNIIDVILPPPPAFGPASY